jgi:hypothetical protein
MILMAMLESKVTLSAVKVSMSSEKLFILAALSSLRALSRTYLRIRGS